MEENILLFASREEFSHWLSQNVEGFGVWLLFGKKGGPKTLTAAQALEEALCYGWIDGQMQSIDDTQYKKYFSPRRPQSKWSEKNRNLVKKLEEQNRMTDWGRLKIREAKEKGNWDSLVRIIPSDEQVNELEDMIKGNEPAYTNFMNMTKSVKQTYTGAYLSVKDDMARKKRLDELVQRFTLNLNPMQSLKKFSEKN